MRDASASKQAGCERVGVPGRPYDLPGCAASSSGWTSIASPYVSFARLVSRVRRSRRGQFCEIAISEGGKTRRVGRVAARPAKPELFGHSLGSDDRVVLEATGNALAIAGIIAPHVGEVVLAHSGKVRAIAETKVKTDAIDACTLAELLAADLVPRVWRAISASTRSCASRA